MEKVGQQRVSLLAKNAFRVELYAFEIPLAVTNPHDFTGFAKRGNLKAVRQGIRLNQQRMIAGNRQRVIQPAKDALLLMENRRGLPCMT